MVAKLEAKLDSMANINDEDLFLKDQMIAGHEALSAMSVTQLCTDHESLNIKREEALYLFYTRCVMSKMKDVYLGVKSPVHEAMLYIPGDGRQHVKPGVMVEKSILELTANYVMGLGITEHIFQENARIRLQIQLSQIYQDGHETLKAVGWRYAKLLDKQKLGEAENVPSFNSQSGTSSIKPGTPEYDKYIDQSKVAGLKQTPLDRDEALELSRDKKIGDVNKADKHEIRRVGGDRPKDELFLNTFRQKP